MSLGDRDGRTGSSQKLCKMGMIEEQWEDHGLDDAGRKWWEGIKAEKKQRFDAGLAAGERVEWPWSAIAVEFRSHGVDVSEKLLRRHSIGQCRCVV